MYTGLSYSLIQKKNIRTSTIFYINEDIGCDDGYICVNLADLTNDGVSEIVFTFKVENGKY